MSLRRPLTLAALALGWLAPAAAAAEVRARGFPDAEAAALEREGAQGKGIVLGKGAAERDLLQQGLLEVITADGEVQDGEARRLKRVVASLGLAPRDIIPPLRALLG